jgi:hypothetical protein
MGLLALLANDLPENTECHMTSNSFGCHEENADLETHDAEIASHNGDIPHDESQETTVEVEEKALQPL